MALKRINKKAVEDIVTFAWQASQSFVIGLTGAEIFITSLGFQTVAILSFQLSSWVTYWIQKYHSHLQKVGPLPWQFHSFLVFGLTGAEISITSLGFETLGMIESILSYCITVWFGSTGSPRLNNSLFRKAIQSVVKTAEKNIGSSLPSIRDMAYKRYRQRC